MTPAEEVKGRKKYEAFFERSKGVSVIDGSILPSYDNLPEKTREAFSKATK